VAVDINRGQDQNDGDQDGKNASHTLKIAASGYSLQVDYFVLHRRRPLAVKRRGQCPQKISQFFLNYSATLATFSKEPHLN
jgi:hypothetical protein